MPKEFPAKPVPDGDEETNPGIPQASTLHEIHTIGEHFDTFLVAYVETVRGEIPISAHQKLVALIANLREGIASTTKEV